MTADILIVDDEADIRGMVQGILQDEGYSSRMASNSQQAYAQLASRAPDLVILDIWLQHSEHDGLQILSTIKKSHPHMPVVMISGHGTIETAVSALKQGAYDFIEKPFKADRLLLLIERALEAARLRRENETLKQRIEGPSELIGDSQAMALLRQALERVAPTNSRILLTGEPGTGKDIAARAIHRLSRRAGGPFMAVNCAILRPELLEIELFGSETAPGVLEKANGGTLLLDEVADMPLETQGKIVRVLQEQKFQRGTDRQQVEVDLRIIASTNRNLTRMMEEGRFRQDLFYRLNVVPIEMPPLRGHPEDIPALAAHFSRIFSGHAGMPECRFSEAAHAALQAYGWPGNVRQLRNVVEWTMIMGKTAEGAVRPDQLPSEIGTCALPVRGAASGQEFMTLALREAREVFERNYLLSQLKRFSGNISRTAQFVGMERSALHRKLKLLGIADKPGEAEEPPQDVRRIA